VAEGLSGGGVLRVAGKGRPAPSFIIYACFLQVVRTLAFAWRAAYHSATQLGEGRRWRGARTHGGRKRMPARFARFTTAFLHILSGKHACARLGGTLSVSHTSLERASAFMRAALVACGAAGVLGGLCGKAL